MPPKSKAWNRHGKTKHILTGDQYLREWVSYDLGHSHRESVVGQGMPPCPGSHIRVR